jgi:hypothetical protein
MAALLRDELHIVVTECGNDIWEWEICRQGEPLPARMRDGPFKSQEVALAAGKIALREFLQSVSKLMMPWLPVPSARESAITRPWLDVLE